MAPSLRSLALPLAKTLPRSFRAKPHPDPERVTLSPKVCLAQPCWDWEELQWDSHSRDGRGTVAAEMAGDSHSGDGRGHSCSHKHQ